MKIIITLFFPLISHAILVNGKNFNIDKEEIRDSFELKTGKQKDLRIYFAKTKKEYDKSPETISEIILDIHNRCNNELKNLRKNVDINFKCKFHNPIVIETVVHPIIKKLDYDKSLVVTRYIKSNGLHRVNELVTMKRSPAGKSITIKIDSISNDIAFELTGKKIKADTKLKSSSTLAILSTKPNSQGTVLEYYYEMQTDHWLVNKLISAPKVFDNMHKNISSFVNLLGAVEVSKL